MSYTRLRYHLVMATENHQELLTPQVNAILYPALQKKALDNGGKLLKIGGRKDHVHTVAWIPRTVAVTDFVCELKEGSSQAINKSGLVTEEFHWQKGYGALSLNPFQLRPVLRYVADQETHHKNGTLWPEYERARCDPSQLTVSEDMADESQMSYTCLRYHLTTGTKMREMLLTPAVEAILYPALHKKALDIGCRLLEANGAEDHMHLIAVIQPTISVADFMRILKTDCSAAIKRSRLIRGKFNWQDGYGGFTLEAFNLNAVRYYVINQKEHHKSKNLWPGYEKTSGDNQ
ncbi:MAG: IS200/IS605 family transposase [Ardenticatenaceae bacterium]